MTNFLGLSVTLFSQGFTLLLMWLLDPNLIGNILELSLIGYLITALLYFGSDQALSVAYVNHLNQIKDDNPNLRECVSHVIFLGLAVLFICLIPLYFFHSLESSFFLILSVSLNFYVLKGIEIFLRSNNKLSKFFLISLFQVFVVNLLFLFFWAAFGIDGLNSMTFSRILSTFFLAIFIPWKLIFEVFKFLSLNKNVIKYFSNFSLNGIVSYILSQIDKLLASWHFDGAAYAALSLMSNLANLISFPKIITSNQFIRSVSNEKFYLTKVRVLSLIYSFCFGVILLGSFFLLKDIILTEYKFENFIWIFLLSACLIEILIGPIGLVLQYNYSVKYVVLSDLLTTFTLIIVFLITKDFNATALLFGVFFFLSRVMMVLTRFIIWKYIKNV